MDIDTGAQKQAQALAVFCIVLAALALSYVGDDWGIWQRMEMDLIYRDGSDSFSGDVIMIFKIQEVELEVDYDKDAEDLGLNDDRESVEYGEGEDDDAMVDDMEDMMKNIRMLLFVTVFAALGIIFFCNKGDFNSAKNSALVVASVSLVMGIYFMSGFTDSLEDAYDGNDSDYPLELNGFQGSANMRNTNEDGVETTISVEWGPGIAWFLVTLVIPVFGGVAAHILTSSKTSSYQSNYQYNQESVSLPSIPSLNGPANSLELTQVQCSNCKVLINANLVHCPNCGFQIR